MINIVPVVEMPCIKEGENEPFPKILDRFSIDPGVAEALRRDAELDRDPSLEMTLDELRRGLGR